MRLPRMNYNNNIQRQPLAFTGLNRRELLKLSEMPKMKNISTENFPKLSPRRPRATIDEGYDIHGYGFKKTDNHIFDIKRVNNDFFDGVVDLKLRVDKVEKGDVLQNVDDDLSKNHQQLIDFNGHIVIFPAKKYYIYDPDNPDYDTFSSFTITDNEGNNLEFDYAYPYMNRLFAIKGNDIRASKQGDFKVWNEFNGYNTDSWAADVYSEGKFTGLYEYQHHLVIFKDTCMYELYGNLPSNFTTKKVCEIGCIDYRSIAEVNGKLYFLSNDGIYEYAGGIPRKISLKLNDTYKKGIAIGDNRYYYIHLSDGEVEGLYRYDTYLGEWIYEDSIEVKYFDKTGNKIFMQTRFNGLIQLDYDSEKEDDFPVSDIYDITDFNESGTPTDTKLIEWEAYTKEFDYNLFNKKILKKVKLKADIKPYSELIISIKYDDGPFRKVKVIRESIDKRHKRDMLINIPIKKCEYFQIKIEGKGRSILNGELEFILGSEK